MTLVKKFSLCALALVLLAMTTTSQNNASQIVFSDTGASMTLTGNSKASSTPFGFWIWCAGAAAPGSNGGYQKANACQGQMYFYALQTQATHVIGFATENPSGFYTMHVVEGTAAQLFSGTLKPTYTCTLTNTSANSNGPNSTVLVGCMFIGPSLGGGTGSSTDTGAVVNTTGPGN